MKKVPSRNANPRVPTALSQVWADRRGVVTTALASAAFTLTSMALAAAPTAGGANDPVAVLKKGMCGTTGVLKYMTDPTLVGIALVVTVAVAAWGGWMFSNKNASSGAKTGFICAAAVLGCSTIAGAFATGC